MLSLKSIKDLLVNMILIIHGDDISASRNFFLNQKNKESLLFDAVNLEVSELLQSVQGSSLFEESKKILIDNLFSKKAAKNYKDIVQAVSNLKDCEIILWSDKELSKKVLSEFPDSTNNLFKIPQNIFSFLDSIRPNSLSNVKNFQNALKTSDPEIIFAMIVRQFRLLHELGSSEKIDEVARLAPWQKSKLEKQMSLFGQDKIKNIYKKLCIMDKEQKTGQTNLTLSQNIDIFLLEI